MFRMQKNSTTPLGQLLPLYMRLMLRALSYERSLWSPVSLCLGSRNTNKLLMVTGCARL